ncbi:hypothetical protein HAX54_023570 [Datura stramonium]|uniref:chalcone synthase n=1 Tax=Datura stramonium TaxID=4076 RepID=A0ABS8UY00_DATST|nr:hypothetical protein [Datura stramonium]
MHLTEEILKKNPNFCEYKAPSLDARQEIAAVEVPKLGKEAAQKAINEWGQPISKITHLIFCTTSGVDMPGADYQLTKLLGLRPSVKRLMIYQQGCSGAGAALRLAKDLAENNKDARVLVVCSELMNVMGFRGPSDTELNVLVGQALIGDGASAAIIGSDPILSTERPLFELIFTVQTLLLNSGHAVYSNLTEAGLIIKIHKDTPILISKDFERIIVEALQPLGISDWNSVFWAVHPDGRAIVDQIELKLCLRPEKLKVTRHVLSDYGNMGCASVLFVLDEMRKTSIKKGLGSTGEGLEWGVVCSFGSGLTIEAIVLRILNTYKLEIPPSHFTTSTISSIKMMISLCSNLYKATFTSGSPSEKIVTVDELRRMQRAGGPATVLGIGTANPLHCFDQSTYPEYFFRVTNNEHKTELIRKFRHMCEKSMIKKRYMHLTEEILKKNPNFCEYKAPSLDARQEIAVVEVPKLGKEAAQKAIKEWGQPISKITHLIFCTTSGVDMPGADYQLTNLLGLCPSVKRLMIYQQGCSGAGAALRLAKDLAENNKDARVLVVCSELMNVMGFRGPSDTELNVLVGQALIGDGASAAIIGSDPIPSIERPLFELIFAIQTLLPDSGHAVYSNLTEAGLIVKLHKDTPMLISKNIERIIVEVFQPLGISDWNSIFWVVHPGGRAIVDQIESKLGLKPEKLKVTRHVLSDYGNMGCATVLFVLDEMRKTSMKEGLGSTGEGLEWGVLCSIGSGLTIEAIVLRSIFV